MSAPDDRPPEGPDDGRDPKPGRVQPLGPGPVVILGLVGLVAGWAVRPASASFDAVEPVVPIWAVLVVWLVAAAVGLQARLTWRTLQRPPAGREGLTPAQAVNRLVLGQAVALAGSAVLGLYAGIALSQIGAPPSELADDRLWRGLGGAAGGAAMLAAGLWLERACRVRPDDEDSLP